MDFAFFGINIIQSNRIKRGYLLSNEPHTEKTSIVFQFFIWADKKSQFYDRRRSVADVQKVILFYLQQGDETE